jgi:DNA-binding response OmpR family regulator
MEFDVERIASKADAMNTTIVNTRYDVILLDLQMPNLNDGLDILTALRGENSVNRESRIIVVSIRDDHEAMRGAYDRGCDDYLDKPVELDKLREAIKKPLKKR